MTQLSHPICPKNKVEHTASAAMKDAVRHGLMRAEKSLPPFLFYDERGSDLFERITVLPEYYLTRTERGIMEKDARRIASTILSPLSGPVAVLELGAGTATKTEVLLHAFAKERADLTYFPADVSDTPVLAAQARLKRNLPQLRVSPILGTHAVALERIARWNGSVVVLFIGSSIGNYDDADAADLLNGVRAALGDRGVLLLGVDRKKSKDVLVPAYDDAAGVTAAFNRNVLVRINRELGADFDVSSFRHVAVWNDAAGAMEMHLESTVAQTAHIAALGMNVSFERGERIHTESSHKYDHERAHRLLSASGMHDVAVFSDAKEWFSLYVAAPVH